MRVKRLFTNLLRQLGNIGVGELPIGTLFAVGLFGGIILIHLGKGILLENTGLLDEDILYHMKYMTVDGNALFYYVLRERMGAVLLLTVLSTTYLGLAVCAGASFWYGVCMGSILSVTVYRYGVKGILLAGAGMLPQYLIYVPAMFLLLKWCESVCRGIYRNRIPTKEAGEKYLLPRRLLQIFGLVAVFLIGCLLESYVNPHMMISLLQIF